MTRFDSPWLTCATPDCCVGTHVDPRHLANLTATGAWSCADCSRGPRARPQDVLHTIAAAMSTRSEVER